MGHVGQTEVDNTGVGVVSATSLGDGETAGTSDGAIVLDTTTLVAEEEMMVGMVTGVTTGEVSGGVVSITGVDCGTDVSWIGVV